MGLGMLRNLRSIREINMSKINQKISAPGSIKMPTKGGRNATTNEAMRGSGMAPKPTGGAPIPGNDRPTTGAQAGLARVSGAGSSSSGASGSSGSFMPVKTNNMANLRGS